ncbi:MAG: PQQ-like beta-propeller repeat protein, partial [Chloroflexi bacterium]|nr:PQQ-like beta-propeller repeat protein [Chloroflexota bacterium]
MRLSRRAVLGQFATLAVLPLLAACEPEPSPTAALLLTPLPTQEPTATAVPTLAPTPEPLPTPAPPPPVGRPMYQMDAQHTGRTPNRGPREPRLLRSFDTGNFQVQGKVQPEPDIQSSAAVGADGMIYLANQEGILFALRDPHSSPGGGRERSTLELAWRCHPPDSSSWHATPALAPDGTVYLGFSRPGSRADLEATLYALRPPSSGLEAEVAWAFNLGPGRQTSSPTLGPDGTVYVVSGTGWLFAISPDGHERWSVQTGPSLKAAPALSPDGQTVYVSSMDGNLYAVAAPSADGGAALVRWKFAFADFPGRTPLMK